MSTAARGASTWNRPAGVVASVLVILALAILPAFVAGFYVTLVTRMMVMALFAVAFNIVFGMGGMHSLGHAAFFGLGGYTVGLGVTRWDWGFATIIAVALLIGAVAGLLMGLLTQRTDGIYLLLLTLAAGQALWGLAFQQVELTRGDNGISDITREIIPLVGTGRLSYYHLVLAVAVVCVLMMWAFVRSPVGQAIVGTRESTTRMAALGYRVGFYRSVAFTVSGTFSALAGVLSVWHHRFVNPDVLDWPLSATILVVAIIGGAGSFLGPAIGASLIIGLEFWVSLFTERWVTVLGLVYVLAILFFPDGLLGFSRRLRRRVATQPEDDVSVDDRGPSLTTGAAEGAR